jgi:hypothetical protein
MVESGMTTWVWSYDTLGQSLGRSIQNFLASIPGGSNVDVKEHAHCVVIKATVPELKCGLAVLEKVESHFALGGRRFIERRAA